LGKHSQVELLERGRAILEDGCKPVVLVVEDEPMIRMMAVDVFEDEGFEVMEAPTAPVALALMEKRADVAALFTDIDMPGGMNGLELAAVVHRHWPHVALVVTSGVFRPAAGELPGDGVFLPKPYKISAPARVMRDLLERKSQSSFAPRA
jgi:CheY-like chemotaxis protein